jgi:hypothetical protein
MLAASCELEVVPRKELRSHQSRPWLMRRHARCGTAQQPPRPTPYACEGAAAVHPSSRNATTEVEKGELDSEAAAVVSYTRTTQAPRQRCILTARGP